MTAPLVSVVMSVYNGARDVPVAVRSILDQTFTDFELIAIDNGSFKDDTRQVLQAIARGTNDPRVRIVQLDTNIGLAGALNHGIGLARGKYIARQDHDDISKPTRLEKQVAYMEAHPDTGLLGTRSEIWVGDTATTRSHQHPVSNSALQFELIFDCPFVHSSVMIRRTALHDAGLYTTDPNRQPPEDYELWSRIARLYKLGNLPEKLLVYREVADSMSRSGGVPFRKKVAKICSENLARANGLEIADSNCSNAAKLCHRDFDGLDPEIDITKVIQTIIVAGRFVKTHFGDDDVDKRIARLASAIESAYVARSNRGENESMAVKFLSRLNQRIVLSDRLKKHLFKS